MADVLEPEVFTAGDYIIREDTHGDTFYILAKGEVRVTKKVEGEEKHIRDLTQGEYFGEQVYHFKSWSDTQKVGNLGT